MIIREGGANRTITIGRARVGGSTVRLTRGLVHVGNATRTFIQFVQDLIATVTPESGVSAFRNSAGTATTSQATATPSGGLGPYTYLWERVGAGSSTADTPTSANTTFSRDMTSEGTFLEDWRCTITDSLGTPASDTITATFVRDDVDLGSQE